MRSDGPQESQLPVLEIRDDAVLLHQKAFDGNRGSVSCQSLQISHPVRVDEIDVTYGTCYIYGSGKPSKGVYSEKDID